MWPHSWAFKGAMKMVPDGQGGRRCPCPPIGRGGVELERLGP